MPSLWMIAPILVMVTLLTAHIASKQDEKQAEVALHILGGEFSQYSIYVARYAHDHPSAAKTVLPRELGLPSWYLAPSSIQAYVANGRAFSYLTTPPAPVGLAGQIYNKTGSAFVGIAEDGHFKSVAVNGPDFILPEPADIPEGAVVVISE